MSDHDPRPPVPTRLDPERDGGRGLLLVEAVSDRWGYYYPATDPGSVARGPAVAPGFDEWLAAPMLPTGNAATVPPAANAAPGKIVWALLSPV